MDSHIKEQYAKLRAEADAIWENAKPQREALESALQPFYELEDQIDKLIEGADVAQCENCKAAIFEGDPCTTDVESSLTFCEDCSPSWADLLADPTSFYLLKDGEPEYFTEESAKAATEAHLSGGGSITDKFGLHPY